MQLSDYQTLVKRQGFDDTDPLTQWLNMAKNEVAGVSEWYFSDAVLSVPMAPGVSSMDFSAQASKIIYIKHVENKHHLKWMDRRLFVRNVHDPTVTGDPDIYTWLQGMVVVQFYPVPVTSVTFEVGAQLVVPDLVNPTDVLGGANPWPDLMQNLVVFRASAIGLQFEDEEEKAQTMQTQYENGLTIALNKFGVRNLDEAETVVDAQGYGDYEGRYSWRY
jgi:hypothetical protein